MWRWTCGTRKSLSFTREVLAELFTKLCVRYRDQTEGSNDRSMVVFCVSYERLASKVDLRVTQMASN
jgi:Na+-transporting NADH:ubiquinone oxidoreductase subunit NqrA